MGIKIAIIEPVGGKGGADYYDYGLAYGLASNNIEINYHACSKTKGRDFDGVVNCPTFKNVWSKPKFLKLFLFIQYYQKAIKHAKNSKCTLVHFQFFSFTIPNFLALLLSRIYRLKTVVTVHDVDLFKTESPDDLANTILSLTKEQIEKVTREAQKTINQNFDWVEIGKTKQFYKEI